MNKKLIIFMPSIEGGGVEKNLFIISNFLAKKINNVYLITANSNFKKKFKNIYLIHPKKKFEHNDGRYIKYFHCLIELVKLIYKLKKETTVFAFQANLYCAIICKILRVKIITRSNSSPSGWSKNIIKNVFFRFILKFPEEVIVNSKKFQIEIRDKFNVKTTCIYNPLDEQNILKKSKEKSKFDFFKNSKNFLKIIFVGRLVDQKDPLTLLKSLNKIKNKIKFKALIMGKGILEQEIKKNITNSKMNKNINVIKFQKNPYKFMYHADVLILTSKYEGLPNVLLEAQVLKKSIISSNCPTGPSEILMNGRAGYLFKVGDYNELSKKIEYSYINKIETKNKIKIGSKNLKRFDYNKNLKKYLEIVKKYL